MADIDGHNDHLQLGDGKVLIHPLLQPAPGQIYLIIQLTGLSKNHTK